MALATHERWMKYAVDKNIQWLISLDQDDPYLPKYRSMFADPIVNANGNLVQAVHNCIPLINGDLVVVVSDDFSCPQFWDAILRMVESEAVYVNDGISYGRKCMTLPVLKKSLIDKLGYIYYPKYTGMFVDNDLYEVCEKMGVLSHLDVIFQHNHYSVGRASLDPTYKRHNNNNSWRYGENLIRQRRKENFGL
jgi:hypothetical protein